MEDSILDKVIDSQKNALAQEFNPQQILSQLVKKLNDREKEVLNLRHGLLDNQKRTLEEIGNRFKVTRERIRQIENSALKKIKNHEQIEELLKPIEIITYQVLEENGGIMHEDILVKKILDIPGLNSQNLATGHFMLSQLLKDKMHYISGDELIRNSWKLPTSSLNEIKEIAQLLVDIIDKINQPVSSENLLHESKNNDSLPNLPESLSEQIVENLLQIIKVVAPNPYKEWGLANWNSISLKRMSDKIYLILKKHGQPMHFTEIAKKINETGFDHKKANPATIHNELILDKKYILVGRGIYALAEWGYKPGVVSDVIQEILKEAKLPLSREEIIEKVMAKRLVKRSTIILALMNKNKFKKTATGEYDLV